MFMQIKNIYPSVFLFFWKAKDRSFRQAVGDDPAGFSSGNDYRRNICNHLSLLSHDA